MSCGGNRHTNANAAVISDLARDSQGRWTRKEVSELFHEESAKEVARLTAELETALGSSPTREERKSITQEAHATARRNLPYLMDNQRPKPAEREVGDEVHIGTDLRYVGKATIESIDREAGTAIVKMDGKRGRVALDQMYDSRDEARAEVKPADNGGLAALGGNAVARRRAYASNPNSPAEVLQAMAKTADPAATQAAQETQDSETRDRQTAALNARYQIIPHTDGRFSVRDETGQQVSRSAFGKQAAAISFARTHAAKRVRSGDTGATPEQAALASAQRVSDGLRTLRPSDFTGADADSVRGFNAYTKPAAALSNADLNDIHTAITRMSPAGQAKAYSLATAVSAERSRRLTAARAPQPQTATPPPARPQAASTPSAASTGQSAAYQSAKRVSDGLRSLNPRNFSGRDADKVSMFRSYTKRPEELSNGDLGDIQDAIEHMSPAGRVQVRELENAVKAERDRRRAAGLGHAQTTAEMAANRR